MQQGFFLHCRTSARHCRSTTGKWVGLKTDFPENTQNKQTTKPTQKPKPNKHHPGKCQRWDKVKHCAPLSPSKVLFHHEVPLHVVAYLDVSHIDVISCFLGRISDVWLQASPLDLISALPSLPSFGTILHECIHFSLRSRFFARECL